MRKLFLSKRVKVSTIGIELEKQVDMRPFIRLIIILIFLLVAIKSNAETIGIDSSITLLAPYPTGTELGHGFPLYTTLFPVFENLSNVYGNDYYFYNALNRDPFFFYSSFLITPITNIDNLSYLGILQSFETPFIEDEIKKDSYVIYEKTSTSTITEKESGYDYFLRSTIVSDSNVTQGYLPVSKMRDNKYTSLPSREVQERVKKKVFKDSDDYIVKKVIKPFLLYKEKDDGDTRKSMHLSKYVLKKKGSLPFNAKGSDGEYRSYSHVYYCDTLEDAKAFTSGNSDVCEFGRATTSLLTNEKYITNLYKDSNDCFITSKNAYTDFLKEFKRFNSKQTYTFDELKSAYLRKYNPTELKIRKMNLANKKNIREKGYPHKGITLDELLREIIKSANEFSLDPKLLLALIDEESGFNPSTVSYVGAIGLSQILPGTDLEIAGKLGIKDYKQDMLYDPKISVRFGAEYLSRMLSGNFFDGNLETALTAYNFGPGTIGKKYSEKRKIVSSKYSREVLSSYFALNDFPSS